MLSNIIKEKIYEIYMIKITLDGKSMIIKLKHNHRKSTQQFFSQINIAQGSIETLKEKYVQSTLDCFPLNKTCT